MWRVAILLIACLATDLVAQEPVAPAKASSRNMILIRRDAAPRYVPFEIYGNPEQMLAEFLKTRDGQGLFQKLLKDEWHRFVEQPPDDIRETLKKQVDANPFLRELVDKFLNDNPNLLPQGNPDRFGDALKKFGEQIEGNKALRDTILKGIEAKASAEGFNIEEFLRGLRPSDAADFELPKFQQFMDDDLTLDDRVGEWLTNFLKREDVQHDLAEFLKDSPELRENFADLMRALQRSGDVGKWLPKLPEAGVGKWNLDLKPPTMPFEVGQLPKLPTITMPRLPRFNLPLPKLSGLGLPRLPRFGGMATPPGAANVAAGSEWLYILAAVVMLGLGWWFVRGLKGSTQTGEAATSLTSLPDKITTRTQLRQAFDAFALLRLGDKARPWNHRLIARQFGGGAMSAAADAFASLYEIARYTPGDDCLTMAEQDAVRASLAVLTEGAE